MKPEVDSDEVEAKEPDVLDLFGGSEYDDYFEGHCVCSHDPIDHGWDRCGIDGCRCEAHWEEYEVSNGS